jgi:hypothetical protein
VRSTLGNAGRASWRLISALTLPVFVASALVFVLVTRRAEVIPSPDMAATPGPFGPSLALLSARSERTTGHVAVRGEVRNITAQQLERTLVTVTWRDENGQFITSGVALIDEDPILAGDTSPFEVVSTWTRQMATYDVRFTTLRGEYLASRDDRRGQDAAP